MALTCKPEIESVIRTFIQYDEVLNRVHLLLSHLSERCSNAASDVFESDVSSTKINEDNSAFMYEMSYILKFVSESLELQENSHNIEIDKIKKELDIR